VKLINIGNRGYREYRTEGGRFHAKWTERQGVRSSYTVTDTWTGKSLRAGTVVEVRETIREMLIREETGTDRPPQIGDTLYICRSCVPAQGSDGSCTWEVRARRVIGVRIDGVELAGLGRIGWGNLKNYHRTQEDAIAAFVAERRHTIETLKENITEAERAIAWANSLANEVVHGSKENDD